MALAFIGFAACRMIASLAVGPWIDRWGAVRLFPVILAPVGVGLLLLSVGTSPWVAFAYLAMAGISQGIASPTMTALWAEIYGVESLGATKGTVSTLGVFATALGPILLGSLLKAGISFDVLIPCSAALAVLATLLSLRARRILAIPRPAPA